MHIYSAQNDNTLIIITLETSFFYISVDFILSARRCTCIIYLLIYGSIIKN